MPSSECDCANCKLPMQMRNYDKVSDKFVSTVVSAKRLLVWERAVSLRKHAMIYMMSLLLCIFGQFVFKDSSPQECCRTCRKISFLTGIISVGTSAWRISSKIRYNSSGELTLCCMSSFFRWFLRYNKR